MHEGKKFEEGHYYGYFRNLASRRWWKLDDEDVEEVREDVVLDDAYAGDSCAFMLQYVLRDSESYRICLETDKTHSPAAKTPSRIRNVSATSVINETSQSQEKRKQTLHPVADVEPLPASVRMEVSDVIANIPPIVEVRDDPNKVTTQSNSDTADTNSNESAKVADNSSQQLQEPLLVSEVTDILSAPSPNEALVPFSLSKQPLKTPSATALTNYSTRDLYLKAIEEMYTDFTTGWLRSNMAFNEDWATTRAVAALKAFNTVKSMLTEGKLVYDDRTSISDDVDSDESGVSNDDEWKTPKKPKKTMLDEEDKKFFTCLPTCYAMFFAFDSKDFVESYRPFAKHNKCWQKKNSLESILEGFDCTGKSFKADGLKQHASEVHSKSWCGMGGYFYMNFTQAL